MVADGAGGSSDRVAANGVPSAESLALLAAVVAELRPSRDRVADRVVDAIVGAEPSLGADEAIALDLRRSVVANIERGFDLFDSRLTVGDAAAPRAAVELATSVVRRGIEPHSIIQAYRVGQNTFIRWWIAELTARVDDRGALVEVLDASLTRSDAYLNAVVGQLLRHYEATREAWLGQVIAQRSALVRALLDGAELELDAVSRKLGFELDRPLVACVLWSEREPDPDGGALERLQELAAGVAAAAGGGRALAVPAGTSILWMWCSAGSEDALERAAAAAESLRRPGEGVALGRPGAGLDGFRASHAEAVDARRVAGLAGRSEVVRHDEVAVVALLSSDPARLAAFVARTLGPLACGDQATARLRESLGAWYAAGGNARLAAERMGAHKNTILYRVRRAEELLGRDLRAGAIDVPLALEALGRLGAAALPDGFEAG